MQITNTVTEQIGDIEQTQTVSLVVGRIDFNNDADYFRHIDRIVTDTLSSGKFARPLSEWREDDGAVLWWTSPVNEPPWAGSPIDTDWPGYHTHWTPIDVPRNLMSHV